MAFVRMYVVSKETGNSERIGGIDSNSGIDSNPTNPKANSLCPSPVSNMIVKANTNLVFVYS